MAPFNLLSPVFWLLWALGPASLHAQESLVPEKIGRVPAALPEASSLETLDGKIFWSVNDGGNAAKIYAFDTSGIPTDSFRLRKVKNIDMEALALDEKGKYLWVGDIGDNRNVRDTLRIYRVDLAARNGAITVDPELITFTYPDKPAPDTSGKLPCAFDCEAMIHHGQWIYIFSKSRCNPRVSKCYRMPDSPGHYVPELLDSVELPTWVTSADLSADGKSLALLSETRLYLFHAVEPGRFLSGKMETFFLGMPTQKEGICFGKGGLLYLCDEDWGIAGGNIYQLDVSRWLK